MDCTPATRRARGRAHGASGASGRPATARANHVPDAQLSGRTWKPRGGSGCGGASGRGLGSSCSVKDAVLDRQVSRAPRGKKQGRRHLLEGGPTEARRTMGDATGLHEHDVIRDTRHWQLVLHSPAQRGEPIEPTMESRLRVPWPNEPTGLPTRDLEPLQPTPAWPNVPRSREPHGATLERQRMWPECKRAP